MVVKNTQAEVGMAVVRGAPGRLRSLESFIFRRDAVLFAVKLNKSRDRSR